MGLFKRKPGGTLIGNLLRGVAKNATGGALGNGAMMISQEDADRRDLSDNDFSAKYGKTKTGVVLGTPANPNITSPEQSLTNSTKEQIAKAEKETYWKLAKKYWYYPVGMLIVGLSLGIMAGIQYTKKKYRIKNRR